MYLEEPWNGLDFGELRSILHQPPSRQNWSHLCALLDRFRGSEDTHAAINYASQLLLNWPDCYRRAPMHWLLSRCTHPPLLNVEAWGIVRALDLSSELLSLMTIAALPELCHGITDLSLEGQSTKAIRIIAALATLSIPLATLRVHHWGTAPSRLTRQLASASFPHLHTLHIAHARLDLDAITLLCRAPWAAQVTRLDLPHNLLQDDAVELLLAHMPLLTHLNLSGNHLSAGCMRDLMRSRRRIHTLLLNHNVTGAAAQVTPSLRSPSDAYQSVKKRKR